MKKKITNYRLQITLGLLLALSSLLVTTPAGAVGVAVNPGSIAISVVVGEPTTTRIKISNPSTDVAVFEVYPDDFVNLIKVVPSSFTLEHESEQYVTLQVTVPESGQFNTLLSVVARPLASNAFAAGSGVKVPITITAQEGSGGFASAIESIGTSPTTGLIGLILLAGWLLYRHRRKK